MNAQKIVETLSDKGFSLWLDSGKLMVRPKTDDETRGILHQHKAEIINLLSRGRNSGNPPSSETEKNTDISATVERAMSISRVLPADHFSLATLGKALDEAINAEMTGDQAALSVHLAKLNMPYKIMAKKLSLFGGHVG